MFTERGVELYDAVYAARGRDCALEAEGLWSLARRLKPDGVSSLLDLCCGTGGHLPFFARHVRDIAAVDLNPHMLEAARRRAPGVCCQLADMAGFRFGRRFDLVVCLFSSIGYARSLEQFRQTFLRIAEHLEPGGLALIEPWYGPQEFLAGAVNTVCTEADGRKIVRFSFSTLEAGLSVVTFHYLVAGPAGVEGLVERHEMGLFGPADYEAAFCGAGLAPSHEPLGPRGRGLYVGRRL